MVTAETGHVLKVSFMLKVNFKKKNPVLPIEKFPSLTTPLLSNNFCSIVCHIVAYERLKGRENFNLLALKVVTVAYERLSLTRDSKYSNLTWKLMVFWKTSRGGEVVASGCSTVINATGCSTVINATGCSTVINSAVLYTAPLLDSFHLNYVMIFITWPK